MIELINILAWPISALFISSSIIWYLLKKSDFHLSLEHVRTMQQASEKNFTTQLSMLDDKLNNIISVQVKHQSDINTIKVARGLGGK